MYKLCNFVDLRSLNRFINVEDQTRCILYVAFSDGDKTFRARSRAKDEMQMRIWTTRRFRKRLRLRGEKREA